MNKDPLINVEEASEQAWWKKQTKSINSVGAAFYSAFVVNGMFSAFAVNAIVSLFSCNTALSIGSLNSIASIGSMNSVLSIGCWESGGFMECCICN